jgi:hypothetical protein
MTATINGGGSLTVSAGFNNGIVTKDDLTISDGKITVTAANHAIRGNDSVTITGGEFNLTAGADGIQTNNETESDKGRIDIQTGTFTIIAVNDGIQSDTLLNILGGTFKITSGNGVSASSAVSTESYKGIKSAGDIAISGGTFAITGLDDGIHSNANITINDGEVSVSSSDYGIHADGGLTIKNGTIHVVKSYEGIIGKSNPDPAVYIDDEMIDLREDGATAVFDEGFSLDGDFLLILDGYGFGQNEELLRSEFCLNHAKFHGNAGNRGVSFLARKRVRWIRGAVFRRAARKRLVVRHFQQFNPQTAGRRDGTFPDSAR